MVRHYYSTSISIVAEPRCNASPLGCWATTFRAGETICRRGCCCRAPAGGWSAHCNHWGFTARTDDSKGAGRACSGTDGRRLESPTEEEPLLETGRILRTIVLASGRACANVRRDDRREASARPGAAWVALPSSQRALLAGRSHSRRVWRHPPTPIRLGDIAPWLKLRVWGKHILVGRDRSRDTCESRSHPYAMLCYGDLDGGGGALRRRASRRSDGSER